MQQEMFCTCETCHNGFFYMRVGLHSRPRRYCDRCIRAHKRDATKARVRAYRQRQREAQTTSHKQPDDNPPRPVADGSRASVARATSQPKPGGLFAGVPDPGRTIKRKAMGLP